MLWNLLLLSCLAMGPADEPSTPKGHLFIVGGGPMTEPLREKMIKLAGGLKAKVLLVPQASNDPEAPKKLVDAWRELGLEQLELLDVADPKAAVSAIKSADLIWMRGGNQTRLMDALNNPEIVTAIRDRYRQGATVAGTSAGAAVMSDLMIAGNQGPRGSDGESVPKLTHGLGLWPEVIVDQHFIRRERAKRLQKAVQDHPTLVGIGIDEKTAVIVSGNEFEVYGESDVIVYDRRKVAKAKESPKTEAEPKESGKKEGGPNESSPKSEGMGDMELATFRLKSGQRFSLDQGPL